MSNDENRDNEMAEKPEVDVMTIAQLKGELRDRRLKVTGNKADLVTRLKAALVLDDQQEDDDNGSSDKSDDEARGGNDDDTRSRTRYVPTFKDVEESIDTFTGDDGKNIKTWIKEFEDLAELCEWNTMQKTIYAKRLLRGSARSYIKADGGGKTWKSIKDALRSEFELKVDSRTIHRELQRRKKRADESYHEYCYKMMEIAARADVETKAVIQYIIDGIDDEGYRKSILYGAKSIRELKDNFDAYAELCDKTKPRTNENKKKPIPSAEKGDAKQDTKRCFNCGSNDHLSGGCPTKRQGTKCFRWNKYGHIATKCTENADTGKEKSCNIIQSDSGGCRKDAIINNVKLSAIIDSGSDISLIREEQYREIGSPAMRSRTIKFRGAGSKENTTLGEMQLKVCFDMEVYDITMHLVRDEIIPRGILIGSNFLNGVEVNIRKGVVNISRVANDSAELAEVYKIDAVADDRIVDVSHIRDECIKDEVECLIENYEPRKEKELDVKMTIILKDDIPVVQNARRLSVAEKTEVDAQIRVWLHEESIRKYTSFVVPSGQYEFLKMPFGLCTSPAYFQKYVNVVFRDLMMDGVVAIYMDDLIISSSNDREELRRLKFVLETAAKYGLSFNWKKCQLKSALSAKPILCLYCPTAETELHTNASALRFGAILLRRDTKDRMFHPRYYASGKMSPAEAKYDSYRLEVLAIVKAHKKFGVYLMGISFTIVTDCKTFAQTRKKKDGCARERLFLEDFRYTIVHRPGSNMKHVNALSRHPLPAAMRIHEQNDDILTRLRRNQLEDKEVRNLIKLAEEKQTDGFAIKNGILCRRLNDSTRRKVQAQQRFSVIC